MWSSSSSSDAKIRDLERNVQDLQQNVSNIKKAFSQDSTSNQTDLIHALYNKFNRLKDHFEDLNNAFNNGYDSRFANIESQLAQLREDIDKAFELQEKANTEIQNKIVRMKMQLRAAESDIECNRIRDRDYGGANVPLPRTRIRRNNK